MPAMPASTAWDLLPERITEQLVREQNAEPVLLVAACRICQNFPLQHNPCLTIARGLVFWLGNWRSSIGASNAGHALNACWWIQAIWNCLTSCCSQHGHAWRAPKQLLEAQERLLSVANVPTRSCTKRTSCLKC